MDGLAEIKTPVISRVFAMPNPDTFSIKPIKELLHRRLTGRSPIVDPFARNSTFADYTNDLNPKTSADCHMDAVEFLQMLAHAEVRAGAVLIDPPYSPRQIAEVYGQIGMPVTTKDTQNARLYRAVKDAADALLDYGGVVICCGWNSGGMGIGRKYRLDEILLVNHGGGHNDTIVTVETKLGDERGVSR